MASTSGSWSASSGRPSVLEPYFEPDPFYSEEFSEHEQDFNNGIREITILILLFGLLSFCSYAFLSIWRRNDERDDEFLPYSWEDEFVYKTSFAICSFSLAVSVGAALLLPISTISNEVLHRYPASWYMKWLNSSLINGIWNLIFVLSNVSLFVFLPFAYLFCESEGLPFFGNKRGLVARAKETMVTLLLLSLTVLGMMYVLSALIDFDTYSIDRLLNVYSYLPFLYSCVSFLGVLMLLICTPLGFARLFTIVGDLVMKPTFMRNLDEEFYVAKFEEQSLQQKVKDLSPGGIGQSRMSMTPVVDTTGRRLKNGEVLSFYKASLAEATLKRNTLNAARKTPMWRRILGYPFVMIFLFALTALSLVSVISNVMQLMAGIRSLPLQQHLVDLGHSSLMSLGVLGVAIEVMLIGYLFVTSLVGLYTIPFIRMIRPKMGDTSLTHLILNCGLFLILSSALPLLSKILGITNFDLLGSFGEVKWLGNIYIVLFCNAVFGVCASLALFNKFTARVRTAIFNRFEVAIKALVPFDALRALLDHYRGVLRDGVAMSRKIHLYISTVFKRNDGQPKMAVAAAAAAVSPSSASSTGLKTE